MQKSDIQLIENYLKGDKKALEILISRYLKPVFGFAFTYVGNLEDAEEITQEAFLKMWKNLKKFDKTKRFKTWLFSITKNTAIDALRKKKALPIFAEEELVDPRPSNIANDISVFMLSLLGKISPNYRAVLLLRYNENLTFREISETLGEPLNTVKSKHQRAILAIRKIIK